MKYSINQQQPDPNVFTTTAFVNFMSNLEVISEYNDKWLGCLSDHFWNIATSRDVSQEERDDARNEWLNITATWDQVDAELESLFSTLDIDRCSNPNPEELFESMTKVKTCLANLYESVGVSDEVFEGVTGATREALARQHVLANSAKPDDTKPNMDVKEMES